jgi:hypothetical protein
MRTFLVVMSLMLVPLSPAVAQVSIQIGLPGVSIGINQPVYPQLVAVPGYPVYYDPGAASNYFFYDGMYWVFQGDSWYASSWYNGPWALVYPQYVPVFILRVPVRYYRHPPAYFRGWQPSGPPRWGEHWGNDWERQRQGWDRWDHASAPRPAPLPVYQKQYSGNRYPRAEQQQELHREKYSYQPRDAEVRRVEEAHSARGNQPEQAKQQQERGKQQQAEQQQQASQQQAKQQQDQAKQQERGKQQQDQAKQQQQQAKQQQQARQQQDQAKQQPPPARSPQESPPKQDKGGQDKGQDQKKDHDK